MVVHIVIAKSVGGSGGGEACTPERPIFVFHTVGFIHSIKKRGLSLSRYRNSVGIKSLNVSFWANTLGLLTSNCVFLFFIILAHI